MRCLCVWVPLALAGLCAPVYPLSPDVVAEVEAVVGPWRIAEPADNGFTDLCKAVSLVSGADEAVGILGGPGAPAPASEIVAANADALAAIRTALARPCAVPPITSFREPFPYLADARTAARVLCVEGRCREELGDAPGALATYLDAIHLGSAIARGGTVIHGLVDVAAIQIASAEVRRLCESGLAVPDATLADAIDRLTQLEAAGPSPEQCFASECEASIAALAELAADPQQLEQLADDAGRQITGAAIDIEAESRALCGYYARVIELCGLPYRDTLGVVLPPDERATPLASLVAPPAERASERLRRGAAALRGARVLLAIVRFHQTKGAYPEALGQLVPDYLSAAVSDPYTGEPFIYADTPDGRALYSPGPDAVDDGADEESDVVIGLLSK